METEVCSSAHQVFFSWGINWRISLDCETLGQAAFEDGAKKKKVIDPRYPRGFAHEALNEKRSQLTSFWGDSKILRHFSGNSVEVNSTPGKGHDRNSPDRFVNFSIESPQN